MKNNFVMFCKTYHKDVQRFQSLLCSFNKYNQDNIKLYVSVPEEDLSLFQKFKDKNVVILTDESYAMPYFASEMYHGIPVGYINQEICKLAFWEAGVCQNYLCIDSEVEFIRDFYVSDFMANEITPYTVLVMDKELSIEKHYQAFWNWRQGFIKKIYKEIGLEDRRLRTCHGMQVLNVMVLQSLKEDFMQERCISYKDLIAIAPYEFTWYNAWMQKCGLIKEIVVEPFFKTFHMRIEYIFSRLKLISREDLAKAYVGIVLNSNWEKPMAEYQSPNWLLKKLYEILKRV